MFGNGLFNKYRYQASAILALQESAEDHLVKLFEDAGILARHDFRDGRSRYEEVQEAHHDHRIDVATGSVIEFRNEEIEKLQRRVAEELGFELIDHRLELYGVPKGRKPPAS